MKICSSRFLIVAMAVTAVAMCSCGRANRWKVNGQIDGASDKTAFLEAVNNGVWYVVDSVAIGADDTFAFTRDFTGYPDIYRITIDGRSMYFPIDSVETVRVNGNFDDFDRNYKLSGSQSADMMQRVNDIVATAVANRSAESDSLAVRRVAETLQQDWGSIVAYYAINKTVGDHPLFDPTRSFDRRIISAVANAFHEKRPGDPRTEMLKNAAIGHRRAFTAIAPNEVYAEQVSIPEINLKDADGANRSLTDAWRKSKVIVLNFTAYGADFSPALNLILSEIYKKYKSQGLEIYQVGCDEDEYLWRSAAKNIPWIAVFNNPTEAARTLLNYNVGALPITYIIDKSGDHVERLADPALIQSTVAKYI